MIQSIGVVGAGTMGHGIAMHFALNGIPTILCDNREEAIQSAKLKIEQNIKLFKGEEYTFKVQTEKINQYLTYTTKLEDLSSVDFITECVSEELAVKQNIFEKLDKICKKEAILVSNTSSLKLSDVANHVIEHKDNCMLTHWFNPPHIVPLVELLRSIHTSEETFTKVQEFLEVHGKVTIEVKKEIPGLVANRIQIAMAREILSLLEDGVAEPKDLDLAVTAGPGFRLSISGLLEIMDFGGIDIWEKVIKQLQPKIASHNSEYKTIVEKIEDGNYGVKTGNGFYEYPNGSFDNYISERDRRLLKHLINLQKINKVKG